MLCLVDCSFRSQGVCKKDCELQQKKTPSFSETENLFFFPQVKSLPS